MQNCRLLKTELSDLAATLSQDRRQIKISFSRTDPANPVRAITIKYLPPTFITPRRLELRIPIPNLYGFELIATRIVLFKHKLLWQQNPIPFCRLITDVDLEQLNPYYSDLRQNISRRYPYFMCLHPFDGSMEHITLAQFITSLDTYFVNPVQAIEDILPKLRQQWKVQGTPFSLAQLAHALEGLGRLRSARRLYEFGRKHFKGVSEFEILCRRAETIQRSMVDR